MPSICLNMIVKNEAPVIQRCLASVRPWIDAWAIVDTGSTDGTQELVQESLAGIPGELFERPWVDFGRNRSEALDLAGTRCDYLLFIDADEEWRTPEGFRWPPLTGDGYLALHRLGDIGFQRATLAATRLPWRWEDILHERLVSPEPHSFQVLRGPWIHVNPDGARSRDGDKSLKDALLLEEALRKDPGNPRYVFYLAQSYRDSGQKEQALEAYRKRASLGGWEEEVWYSLFQTAMLMERTGREPGEVIPAFLRAHEFRPTRPEALGELARYCRITQQYQLAHLFAEKALGIPATTDLLFVDESFPAWRNLDEYALACYFTGRARESERACRRLLSEGHLPESERLRVEANLGFACASKRREGVIPARLKECTRLNLGCGRFPDPEAINIDLVQLPGVDLVLDLDDLGEWGLPFPDDSIETILLSHVLEHLRNPLPLMQELHRVAKAEAVMTIRVPHGASDDAWEDPTHVRPYFAQSFGYYSQPYYWRAEAGYRGDWQATEILLHVWQSECVELSDDEILERVYRERNWVAEMVATLRAVKPVRPCLKDRQEYPRVLVNRV